MSPPQDHALPDVNTLRKMADAHGCAALGHSLSQSLRSPADLGKPIWSEECGLCFGAYEMPSGWFVRHVWGCIVLTLTSFFKFLFNFIFTFGHTMWHAGPSSQTRNQTHTPELEGQSTNHWPTRQSPPLILSPPASLFLVTRL